MAKRRKVGSSLLELAAEAVAEQVDSAVVQRYMIVYASLKVWREEDVETSKLEVAETLQVRTSILLHNSCEMNIFCLILRLPDLSPYNTFVFIAL